MKKTIIEIKNKTPEQFRRWLKRYNACPQSMEWYNKRKNKDLKTTLTAVKKYKTLWYYWTIDKIVSLKDKNRIDPSRNWSILDYVVNVSEILKNAAIKIVD